MKGILVALALSLLAAVPASAAPFTWVVTGTVGQHYETFTPFDPYLNVGDTFTWTINMDSDAPDFDSRSECGVYHPITSMSFTSGTLSRSVNTPPGGDFIQSVAGNSCYIPNGLTRVRTGFDNGAFTIMMHVLGIATTDALPVMIQPHLAYVDFGYGPVTPGWPVIANATAIVTAIPEPGTVGLMGVALLVGLRRLRSRTQGLVRRLPDCDAPPR